MPTALLIIDVQQALCGAEGAVHDIDSVLQRINALGQQARAAGVPVLLVQHEEPDGDFRYGSPGWQLAAGLLAVAGDARVRKTTPDAFNGTDLGQVLNDLDVDGLVICGLQTDFCVDTTVRSALAKGYDVTLVGDAHSTVDNAVLKAEQIVAHHNATFSRMSSFAPRLLVLPAQAVVFR